MIIDLYVEKKKSKNGSDYICLYGLTDYGRKLMLSFDTSLIVELLDVTPRKLLSLSVDDPVIVGSINTEIEEDF